MLFSTLFLSFLGTFLALFLNAVFSLYLTQSPRRKGRLISEKSLHPNETLLTGLADAGKPLTQVLALLELQIISEEEKYNHRRTMLFEAGNPVAVHWRAVVQTCLTIIQAQRKSLEARLPSVQPHSSGPQNHAQPVSNTIGTSSIAVAQANIFRSQSTKHTGLEKGLENFKSQDDSTVANQKQIAQAYSASGQLLKTAQTWTKEKTAHLISFLPRQLQLAIRASPDELFVSWQQQLLVVGCLRNMLLHSTQEDTFGRVHQDVSRIMSELLALHSSLSTFFTREHVELQDHVKSASIVNILLRTLAAALFDIGLVFEEHVELDLSIKSYLKNARTQSTAH